MTKGICPECHVSMLLVTDGFFAECKQSLKSHWPAAVSKKARLSERDREFLRELRILWD